ncbi:MAG: UDP-N-acetylglucosamine--N-acetylmuramyl-(pentapeptide) pyrophosphoryl-undecaprenol N-acetylglucosamine transferase, partial [Actinobacteria bacterium]|nr:UDP-N-acetylglucosamine--N-acetylmuramyl-(pentapeptide) pyrophosphoryl-undecaprenol N-acetylglucosamine transferase [Actinomycetota bacterium]
AGLEFLGLPAAGFDRSRPMTLVTSSLEILRSAFSAWRLLGREHYDVVVCFGGYVSLPVGFAASWRGIPLVLHEQNSVPGLSNKVLASRATAIALTYAMSRDYFKDSSSNRFRMIGNPVRESVLHGDGARGRKRFGIPDDSLFLLVFGGSLGAQHLNDALVAMQNDLLDIDGLYVVHSVGERNYERVVESLGKVDDPRWIVVPYLDEMGDALNACDLVIARAGATSLAEITALGIPSLLVPFPYATDDHQTKNARGLLEAGAASVVADSELETELFSIKLMELLRNRQLRDTMASAAQSLGRPNATVELADLVEACGNQGM